MDDSKYMYRALALAKKAWGNTWPNPMVGAVIVKNGNIIGEGYHRYAGSYHAEVEALRNCKESPEGASIYVTLEPCCHFGKTPPCTDAIINSGIKKVVAAMKDPNPKVAGKGLNKLKKAGIDVKYGVLQEEASLVNEGYVHFHKVGKPFVTLKIAQTLDGKIATSSFDSKWITGKESKKYVQNLRAGSDAILIGSNTVIRDNPELIIHSLKKFKRYPYRIILDTRGQLTPEYKVFSNHIEEYPVFWVIGSAVTTRKIAAMKKKGIRVLQMKSKSNHIDLNWLLNQLALLDIHNLLVEGGSQIFGAFIDQKLANKLVLFLAPSIMGGESSIPSIGGKGVAKISELIHLKKPHYLMSGNDLLVEGYL
jgi:diaminohydroxyphosphoribosylaminopyrimidine deaminase/5-amino-6-(5-phosphoribosylamino)uracil reductase